MATIRDIAKASGVSVATVSYVLNNGPRPVHPDTRDRVRKHMDRLGYHPNAIARSLLAGRTNTLGVIVYTYGISNPVASPYFGLVLGGILESAAQLRKSTILMLERFGEDSTHNINMYCDGRSDGLLFIAPPETSKVVEAMAGRRIPYLLVSDSYADPSVATIDINNTAAARLMVHYLIARGHRRIGIINGDSRLHSGASRNAGYRQALLEADMPYFPSMDLNGVFTEISGYEHAKSIFKMPERERPSAIFCGSDQIALGALRAAQELDIHVPEDISIAGFDDIPAAAQSHPPLTTVRQPLHQMGYDAVQMLFKKADGGCLEKCELDVEIIERGSVAEPRKK